MSAGDDLKEAAFKFIHKLCLKEGGYSPDSFPNPGESSQIQRMRAQSCLTALAYHNAQLQASAFHEDYDPETFEDLTEPKVDMIHKVSLSLMPSDS